MDKREIIYRKEKGKVGVELKNDGYEVYLLTTHNGYQWSGIPVTDKNAAMLAEAIAAYTQAKEQK